MKQMNLSSGTRVTIIALLEQELPKRQSAKSRRNRNLTVVQLFHKLQLLKRLTEHCQVHESLIMANIKRKPVYYFHSGFFTCQYYLISYYDRLSLSYSSSVLLLLLFPGRDHLQKHLEVLLGGNGFLSKVSRYHSELNDRK